MASSALRWSGVVFPAAIAAIRPCICRFAHFVERLEADGSSNSSAAYRAALSRAEIVMVGPPSPRSTVTVTQRSTLGLQAVFNSLPLPSRTLMSFAAFTARSWPLASEMTPHRRDFLDGPNCIEGEHGEWKPGGKVRASTCQTRGRIIELRYSPCYLAQLPVVVSPVSGGPWPRRRSSLRASCESSARVLVLRLEASVLA